MASKAAIEEGARVLARRDPVLKKMVREHGVPVLHRRSPRRSHFAELARMICYQQLAGRAAAAIHGRFEALFDGPPTPEAVLALPFETLRSVGLSNAKATSIRDLAEKVESGLVELDRVARLGDDKVVGELILVRGIGEWTAHMFLMFQMGGLDIWPTLDFGVRSGFALMYGLVPMPTPKYPATEGDCFRPNRSLLGCDGWQAAD